MRRWLTTTVVIIAAIGGGCGSADETQTHPEVVRVRISSVDDNVYDFDVTLSSPYDSPDRYADAWRIVGPDGTVLGVRELAHHHANEQPFTRSLNGVEIEAEIVAVAVEARDLINGWGDASDRVELPKRNP